MTSDADEPVGDDLTRLARLVDDFASVLDHGMQLARPMVAMVGGEVLAHVDRMASQEAADGDATSGKAASPSVQSPSVHEAVRWVPVRHMPSDDGSVPIIR